MMNTSLYVIESSLQQLADLRDAAEAEGDTESLKEIDDQIAAYLTREAAKVDSYVGLIRRRMDDAASCELEADRLNERAKALLADVERLKANALRVMQAFDVRVISSAKNTIRRQANGGLQPLEIPMVDALPTEYKLIRCTLTPELWLRVCAFPDAKLVDIDPNTEAIRKALAQRVPCKCTAYPRPYPRSVCPDCDGAGTIPNTVTGARLLERGEHVRLA